MKKRNKWTYDDEKNWYFSGEAATEKEVTRPIDRDRAKTTTWKGKWKEGSSSQSESSSVINDIMSSLKKLRTSFTKVHM
jgi:hypothetical protein